MFNQMQAVMSGEPVLLDIEHQADWWEIVDECGLSINAICQDFEFNRQSFVKWINCDRLPRKKNKERVVSAMAKLINDKKLTKHPSYGYATQEQIDKLKTIGVGMERDHILKQIELQTKSNGKKR